MIVKAELARIFRDYGEERHSRAFASRLVDAREKAAIRTTQQLCGALGYIRKSKGKGKSNRIHPATRIFQVHPSYIFQGDSMIPKHHIAQM